MLIITLMVIMIILFTIQIHSIEKNEKGLTVFLTFIMISVAMIIFGLQSRIETRNEMRQNAIEANVAYWHIDPKTGVREFKYSKSSNKVNEPNENTN